MERVDISELRLISSPYLRVCVPSGQTQGLTCESADNYYEGDERQDADALSVSPYIRY